MATRAILTSSFAVASRMSSAISPKGESSRRSATSSRQSGACPPVVGKGTPIAEILDPTDVFVDWYIPNEPGRSQVNEIFVCSQLASFRRDRQILPVSDVEPFPAKQLVEALSRLGSGYKKATHPVPIGRLPSFIHFSTGGLEHFSVTAI